MKNIIKFKLTILLLLLFRVTFGQLPDIVAIEYFFDSDPGYGNAISVPMVADSTIDLSFNADLSGVSSGFHILYVRIKDEFGKWSFVLTEGFLKSPSPPTPSNSDVLPQITQMEYFFDTDPGFGNGLEVPITSDSIVDITFNADYGALNDGFHVLYVRVKDESGNWSSTYTHYVLKFHNPIVSSSQNILPQISQMEYFFDTDPGFGNGTEIPVTSDSLIEISFDADYSLLDIGVHNIYVRVKDENGLWSLLYADDIYKFNPPSSSEPGQLPAIVAMEYYFDIDPGFGNGTKILNTPDSLIIENFSADISILEPGNHLLYIRVKDEFNRWSLSFADYFSITGLLAFLEGPYDSITGLMSTRLNYLDLLPLEQPFDSDPAAVWYYNGNETVSSIPNGDIVDWILLQTRDAISPQNATPATIKENQVAFLLNNGSIVGLDGESSISFNEPIDNELYLVIFQRNHLGVLSAFPISTLGDSNYSYNFSSGPDQVYGGVNGHKILSVGVWGMISGDGNGNGQVTIDDKSVVWESEAGKTNYLSGDYNLDGQVDNLDKNDNWIENNNTSSQIPN